MSGFGEQPTAWSDAVLAARLLAIDPSGMRGAVVRGRPGPQRDRWLDVFNSYLPAGVPVRKLPLGASDDRLFGGIDLAATLRTRKPVSERGILSTCDAGILILAMAERIETMTAARIAAALDGEAVAPLRPGATSDGPARFGVVALDEGIDPEERPPSCLADRLALRVDVGVVPLARALDAEEFDTSKVAEARVRLGTVVIAANVVEALCAASAELGIDSLRAPLLAVRAARANAAIEGRARVTKTDAAVAVRLVLAPRATRMPASAPEDVTDDDAPDSEAEQDAGDREGSAGVLAESLVAAARAALPPGVLIALTAGKGGRGAEGASRRSRRHGGSYGRQIGCRGGDLRSGARLDVIETLKAAAPWQSLRNNGAPTRAAPCRIQVRRGDFKIRRFKPRTVTTTIFVVDASGSTAAQRLAEAKGAVEMLLGECYVRRDQVALLAFRGVVVETLLPPTRSLARAKRSLASLPGGGGTPLASAIADALSMAVNVRRAGHAPFLVFLTDGSANVTRDGSPDRLRAEAEALAAGQLLRKAGIPAVLIDTSTRPRPIANRLAGAMGARYLALPRADAVSLTQASLESAPRSP